MNRNYRNLKSAKYAVPGAVGAIVGILLLCLAYGMLGPVSQQDEAYILIHRGDQPAAVRQQVAAIAPLPQRTAFSILATLTGYDSHIHPGRYEASRGTSTLTLFRHLRNGSQSPMRLTIPPLRTVDDLADFLGEHLEPSADQFYEALTDANRLLLYNKKPETAVCLFLPNTYEVYWTTSPDEILQRMDRESKAYWTPERTAKLDGILPGFTQDQAITLASIIEQETQANAERPRVAGMYINRLKQHMPLQADPTVKFALKDFALKRILHEHLKIDSPYNTYKNAGLPPGPICIPSLASLNAVLNYEAHDYLYMCAKEDFSGSHNFARTYAEHLKNAAKYTLELNRRGIK